MAVGETTLAPFEEKKKTSETVERSIPVLRYYSRHTREA